MEGIKSGKVVELRNSGVKSTSVGRMVSSAVAGFVAYTCTHPLERVKIMR